MKKKLSLIILIFILLINIKPSKDSKILDIDYPVQPVEFTQVKISDDFWSHRMKINRQVTIPFAFKKCEETGRINNFKKAAGLIKGDFEGRRYNDSDVFKVMEGAAYSLNLYPDHKLERYMDNLIEYIALAQEEDGYLYTARTINPNKLPSGTGKERWSNLGSSHELYNLGHMYEAAVAYYLATGKKNFLNIAIKSANFIADTFGPKKRRGFSGHQEIEIGLVKLYRITKNKKYLNLAKFFLDERGRIKHKKKFSKSSDFSIYNQGWYLQAHKPVIDQTEVIGHAVRATYMYSGMADIAALTNNSNYLKAIDNLWNNMVNKKLYLTGGIGSRHEGEAFGDNYELPNKTAYNETCAAIGNVFFNHRLFLLKGDGKYYDVLERILYNGLISGISFSGDRFFYPNPLESDAKYKFNQGACTRKPWFNCACCPVNIARFISSFPRYIYAKTKQDIYINLFVKSKAEIKLINNTVKIVQDNHYPWNGTNVITINPKEEGSFNLFIRIPGWAKNQPLPGDLYRFLKINEEKIKISLNNKSIKPPIKNGYILISNKWKKDDKIHISIPMPIRRIISNPNIKANIGKVAFQRGPIVYCFEEIDNKKGILEQQIPDQIQFTAHYQPDLLKGVYVLKGQLKKKIFTAIPYYAWSHRGIGQMAVWLKR